MKRLFFCISLLLICGLTGFSQVGVDFKINAVPFSSGPKKVFLAGNFNGWNPADSRWQLQPDGKGNYFLKTTLPKGSYEYKITRGAWAMVECNAKGKGIDNRGFKLTKDTTMEMSVAGWQDNYADAKQHTASNNVHIISENFDMPQLGRQRRVWVYLPADYQTSGKKYPVIYMHDGQNLFDDYTASYGEWGIDEFLDSLKDDQQKVIVVGVDHGGDFRLTEYNPYDSKYGKGRGDDYVKFLVETLKPYIDKSYHTLTDAGHTTIAGSSMGGIISMYASLKYPYVFGNAGIFSPAFWIGPQIYIDAKAKAMDRSRYYFVCGDQESNKETADMNQMVTVLKGKGLTESQTPALVIKDAKHNEKQWRGDFPAFYNWLVKEF